jgi:hypothetical protein
MPFERVTTALRAAGVRCSATSLAPTRAARWHEAWKEASRTLEEVPVTHRILIPVAVAAGLLFTHVRDSHAITSCDRACGPNKPCATPCYLDPPPHAFVTRCDQVGPCQRVPDVSVALGDDACTSSDPAAIGSSNSTTLASLAIAWLEAGARTVRDATGQLAALIG